MTSDNALAVETALDAHAHVGVRTGVIDVGSNSIRLAVFEGAERAPLQIFNEKVLCGIGRRLQSTGRLDADGVQSALENLPRFVAAASAMGVRTVHMVATSAVRDAADGAEFAARIKRECGLPVRVLSGDEEARLSALGVTAGWPDADGVIGDLGGGSLELARAVSGVPKRMQTLALGTLRLNEGQADGHDIPATIKDELAAVGWLSEARGGTLYAVGGAWRALARIHMAQRQRRLLVLDGYTVEPSPFAEFLKLIAKQSNEALARQAGINQRRIDTIRPAARVLRQLIKLMKPDRIVFSARGLREGTLFDAVSETVRRQDPLITAARALATQFGRFTGLGEALAAWTAPLFPDEADSRARVRRAGCLLGDLGWIEHPDYRADHSFYRMLTLPIMGLEHWSRAYLAHVICARYGGGVDEAKLAVAMEAGLGDDDLAEARALGLAMRLGYAMSAGRDQVLKSSALSLADDTVCLDLPNIGRHFIGDTVRRRLTALAGALERGWTIRIDGEPLPRP